MAGGDLESAITRFNAALRSLEAAAEQSPAEPSADAEALVRLRRERATLMRRLEETEAARQQEVNQREDIMRRLDSAIAELRRVLGE